MKKKVKPEKIIQKYVINFLREQGIYCARINNNKITGGGIFVKLADIDKGTPDAIACVAGHFVAFEFKRTIGKQSIFQLAQQKNIYKNGGEYFVIRTKEDFEEIWQKNLKKKLALIVSEQGCLSIDQLPLTLNA